MTFFSLPALCAEIAASHEDAMMRSVLTVEEAQGGYGAGNNPNIFRNPILGAAMQFRQIHMIQVNQLLFFGVDF